MSNARYPNVLLPEQAKDFVPSSDKALSLKAAPVALVGSSSTASAQTLAGATFTASAVHSLTLPTIAQLLAAVPGALAGTTLDFHIINPSGASVTVIAGSGGSGLGTLVVSTLTSGHFRVRISSSTAYVVQRL